MMRDYYRQKGVRKAILDFVSGPSGPYRECAFHNENIDEIQRHSPNGGSYFVMDSEKRLFEALKSGAGAFYASYWRYSSPSEASGLKGRDLAWSIKAVEGGLSAVKEVTSLFLEGLEEEGFPSPFVKYSGRLGFDIMIPLERVQTGSPEDLDFISEVHDDLTDSASEYVKDQASFDLEVGNTSVTFKGGLGTCLLTELRWRRGLILAPMSLHPGSGLASVPVLPEEVRNFSVVEASPEKVHPREWSINSALREGPENMVLSSPKGTRVKA